MLRIPMGGGWENQEKENLLLQTLITDRHKKHWLK